MKTRNTHRTEDLTREMTVTFSVALQTDKAATEYAELAALTEQAGFDGLSVFADLGYQPPLPALLAAAGATSTIRLGVAAMNPSLWHPVDIAGQLACLADIAGPRVYLGLTRGSWLGQIGVPGSGTPKLAEAIEVLTRLWDGDDTGFAGRHFSLEAGFRLRYPIPPARPELLIGTWGPRGAALAARCATEVKLGGCANPDMVALMASWLAAEAQRTGTGTPVGVVAGAVTVVDLDREAARALARQEVAMYLGVVAGLDRTVRLPAGLLEGIRRLLAQADDAGAGALVDDDLLDRFSFAGTPDDVARQAIRLAEAGATRIEFGTPHGISARTGIQLLGEYVLPTVRRHLTSATIAS